MLRSNPVPQSGALRCERAQLVAALLLRRRVELLHPYGISNDAHNKLSNPRAFDASADARSDASADASANAARSNGIADAAVRHPIH